MATPRPFALIILDGWGYREATQANAIAAAKKPHWDHLWNHYAHTLVSGSGRCVGLPTGQMGNSEVGHLNMGAGRVMHQDLTRIESAIETGEFNQNPVLLAALATAKKNQAAVHVLGLVSPGGVHSHENHIQALISLAATQQTERLYVHAILDGRDTPPRSARASLEKMTAHCKTTGCGQIASVIGRYYAMDRDQRWDRVQQAYDVITEGKADYQASTAVAALDAAYAREERDEFVKATAITTTDAPITIADGDVIIFMNFRADRARELTQAFIERDFVGFPRHVTPKLANFVTLTEYDATFPVAVAFGPERLTNTLGDYVSQLGWRQLRIAETEKYAHVTFFFNGGEEKPNPGEDRILIPSPKVATYDLQPEMSANDVTERLVAEIQAQQYDLIICNFANPDMVGHTGDFAATVKAIEVIDACLAKITAALQAVGGEALITADHGNAELMFNEETQQAHTAHTCEKVPLIYVGRPAHAVQTDGTLADIAPTLLRLVNVAQPPEMTGTPLFALDVQ